jgi:hypothetical protein
VKIQKGSAKHILRILEMDPDEIPKDADKKFICNDSFSDMSMSRHVG